ncbi:MAG: hypothetical protein IKH57_09240 [Clostridia bacterium]|nr:hypothetical protein [Clostridia bacterium]
MAKRIALSALALLLCVSCACAELTVERNAGEMYFPDENSWVYHFTYAYPRIAGDDYTAALINDTYQMALDEMTQLVLPMFANAPDMRFDGKNEVKHDFSVYCNNGALLSIVQVRTQSMGEETMYSLEPLTFDVHGMYAGETLTLRGVMMVLAGVNPEALDDASAEDYPQIAHIINGSSGSMAEELLPALYERFSQEGIEISNPDGFSLEDFELEFSASRDFAVGEDGSLLFFFPPMLMREPGIAAVSYTVSQIESLLSALPAATEAAE